MSNTKDKDTVVTAQISTTTKSHRIDGVGVWNLHVMVYQEKETNLWVAQGIEIDYVAQGVSPEETKKNFEDGFLATIDKHLELYGHIRKLCDTTIPDDVYFEMQTLKEKPLLYSQMSVHVMRRIEPLGPEAINIDYLTEPKAA